MRRFWRFSGLVLLTGCGSFVGGVKQQVVVQPDLRLPRGARIALVPLSLYGFPKEQRMGLAASSYSSITAALLKSGFRVVERTLVEKAVDDYAHTKKYEKTPGLEGAVYQESGTDEEKVIDLVEIGRTLNVRLVAAGSLALNSGFLESTLDARLRVTDVTNGEMVSHCEGSGNPSVVERCALELSTEMSVHALGASPLGIR